MERARKNVHSFMSRFLVPILVLGTALMFTNCSSLKQLFDLQGIIVSKDDQVFQGESTTVIIDISDANKSYSFKATSDPVDNGYPIKFETSNTSTVRVSQSASDPSNYTITAVNTGWCEVNVMCSVAYKFTFVVYVTDNAKGVTVSSLSNQRDEYYASLAEAERTVEDTTPTTTSETTTAASTASATKLLTSSSSVKIKSDVNTAELYSAINFTSTVDAVDEELLYQWYSNGKALGGTKTSKDGRMSTLRYAPIEATQYSVYLEVTGAQSGVKVKSAPVVVNYILVDHRPEYAGAYILSDKSKSASKTGKFMTLDGKIYDILQNPRTSEWLYNNEPVATLAPTGYVITDHVSTNKTYIDSDDKGLRVTTNGVENIYVKASITPRGMQFVDSTTSLRISSKYTNVEVGSKSKIIVKISELDEDVTYQWYAAGKPIFVTDESYEATSAEAKSIEYYVVAKGAVSGKTVTSNKLTISFYVADHRSEFAGAWLRSGSSPTAGKYITADGKIRDMYKDAKSGEWIYKPEVVATIAADGNTITDNVSTNISKIENGKLVVSESKVLYTYAKSTVTPRPAVYVDSSTILSISAKNKSIEVGTTSKIIAKHSELDEDLTYQWYAAGKPVSGTESSYSATSAEAKTIEYYVVATGVTSKKTVTSNKISITYSLVDHRAEFAGTWVNEKNAKDGLYMSLDGKLYEMYKDDASGEWIYKPSVIVVMASSGYDFTVRAGSSSSAKINNGKIVLTAKGIESTYAKSTVSARAAKYLDASSDFSITAYDKATNSTVGNGVPVNSTIKFKIKTPKLDETVTYQWYVNGTAVKTAGGTSASFENTCTDVKTNEYYLVVKGSTSGNTLTTNKVSVNFYAVDHRAEFAGAWVKDKLKASGKYMTADGKIYDMYWDGEGAGEWIYTPEVVATMAATGYEITDHVAANKTKIVDGKIVVTTDKVDLVCSKSVITPRIAKYVDSTTKVTISADKTSVEAGNGSVTITSNVPALDENVTYQWYINGSAANNSRSANSYYEDECSEPRTFEYYVVVKGKKSGKSVTSNKVSVTFKLVDHRPEFTGLWVSEKNNGSAFTILSDGSVMGTYCDADTNEWIYRPTVEAVMRSSGYSFEDKISNQYVSIKDGKLKVVNKGTETLYNKASDVSSRAQKMISSDTKYVLTASQSTVPVNTDVTLKTTLTNCDEEIDFQWFCDDKKESSSKVTAYKFVTQYSEPMTHSYYVVATGRTSKKTVKSNVVTIKFVMDSIRPEMAGAWVNKSNSNDAVYFKPNGQLFKINKKSGSDWYYMPNPIGELADDSAVINETDPSTYKIWVNRTEGTLYIETNGKKSEYKQNKSIKAREGKFISSITQKITPTLSKTKIAANDNPASLTITLPTAAFDALDEGVTYQWINAETGLLFKNATTPTYTFTRSDSKTADEVIKRAVRVTGNITGVTYTTEAATFTVEARDQRTDLVGFWAQSASDTSGYVIMSNGMVYKAFAKKKTEGKKTSSDVFYYGTNIATVNRLGKFTSTEYNFSFDLASTTLKIESADIQKYGKSNSAAYKLITTATPVEAKLLTKNTRVSLVCDTTKVIIPDAPAAKFTATIPAVDEDVVISWYVDGVVTGYTGTEYVFRALPTHAGKTIKVKAEAKGVRSGVVISSDEMSLTASLNKASTKTDGNTIKDNELNNARVERTIK